MSETKWIMSEGGPLIFTEKRVATSWGGTAALTVPANNARTDYDRACLATKYLESIALSDGAALVIGDAPVGRF